MRMPDKDEEQSAQATDTRCSAKSYDTPSVQDEYGGDRRPARTPSPPVSEASNPPSVEQPTSIANISPELIAHLTEKITKKGKFGSRVL